jgi:hypothetical protein
MKYYLNRISRNVFGYDPDTQQDLIDQALVSGWIEVTDYWPPAPTDQQLKDACVSEAKARLVNTDYSQLPDVSASLTNAADFAAYRSQVRALLINPVANPSWPTLPTAIWNT